MDSTDERQARKVEGAYHEWRVRQTPIVQSAYLYNVTPEDILAYHRRLYPLQARIEALKVWWAITAARLKIVFGGPWGW